MQCYYPGTLDYACSAWYPNLNEKRKKKIQIAQNKCIQICRKLDKRHHISSKEFESINWLPFHKRVHQWINAITFKFVNNSCPRYLNEVYEYAPQCRIKSRRNFVKLKVPFRKTNMGQKGLSYVVPSLWNNLPEFMKKKHCFEYFSFIYLFNYYFSLLFLTFILPIYPFLSPLSQSILYYLLCVHFVISCS